MEKMNKNMLADKIVASVMEDQEFYKAFIAAQDAPALQKVLQDKGFVLTIAEIENLFVSGAAGILNHMGAEELDENQLDAVAGGGFFRGTARLIVSCAVGFGYGCLCGVCPAACAGASYVAGGLAVWTAVGYKK